MSNGKNRAFMNNPVAFLSEHVIADHGGLTAGGARVGDFDLEEISPVACLLNDHRTARNKDPQPIHAHYLPAQYNQSIVLPLFARDAKYMFTSSLSGCLFAAYGANSRNVTVEHFNRRDGNATVSIKNRIQEILNTGYDYCKMLSPIAVQGENHVHTYVTGANVIGVSDAAGNWSFHYRKDEENRVHTL